MGRVLLVEDEPNIAAIIVFKLEREGHSVRWETAVGPAGTAAGEAEWDLLLLDSSLDDDPFPLLERLRSRLPVVVMTESRDQVNPGRAARAGAAAVVRKPFKPTVLARVVGQLVRGAASTPPPGHDRGRGLC
jgi:DNA-binding response OmpR family regulator